MGEVVEERKNLNGGHSVSEAEMRESRRKSFCEFSSVEERGKSNWLIRAYELEETKRSEFGEDVVERRKRGGGLMILAKSEIYVR